MPRLIVQVRVKWHGDKILRRVRAELVRRLDRLAEGFTQSVKRATGQTLSNPAPPGRPPRKVTGKLQASYQWRASKELEREIFSKELRAVVQEKGAGSVIIRPKKRSVLTIPISRREAERIAGRSVRGRRSQKRGKNPFRSHGIVVRNGQYFLLRKYARRGPIKPRPHLSLVFKRNRRKIRRVLTARIRV